ncbi:hypothetical protein SteCoe_13384 [Stentor coeruleus]|uniref:Protein kinase domain-containing protein n=1 Tax=Stentor coeruleus TaxID=5963 RepID=A0A1R2C8F8_9CILI|nr:hypothetical protein SteCoe_13384 [Stentor coeruleus]
MGSACQSKAAVNAEKPDFGVILRSSSTNLREEQLKIRKNLMFHADGSENTFMDLSTPRSGRTIRWKRGDLIGEGAYAKVYQCMNIKNGELLAVKHFTLSDDPKLIEKVFLNMKKEISFLKLLDHPNIVHYHQTDMSEDMKSIDVLLEFVPGGSLKTILIKYGALEVDVIKNYSKQLLLGLNYLHENQIVHRDLKPANILISLNGILKLSDFGSSRKFEDIGWHISKSLRGSPYWMAPEVVNREGHSYSADVWSFGCVLLEMASGKPPWSNLSNDSKEIFHLISKDNSYPEIPKTDSMLRSIISLCLIRNSQDRPTIKQLLSMPFFSLEID